MYGIAILGTIVFNLIVAFIFGDIAEKKGYSHGAYFVVVLFFGVIGCLAVAALPDRNKKVEENTIAPTEKEDNILFHQNSCLYAEGAPVVITDGQLLKNDSTGDIHIRLGMTNIQPKPIVAVVVQITTFDYAGRACEEKIRHHYLDLHAEQDDVFGTGEYILVKDPSIRHFQAAVIEVVHADMTLWQGDGTPWNELKALTPLQEKFADDELVKQYKLQLGADCKYFPTVVKEKKLWTCACGAFNSMTSGVCHKCYRSYTDMVSPDTLQKLLVEKNRDEERMRKKEKHLGIIVLGISCIALIACGIVIVALVTGYFF